MTDAAGNYTLTGIPNGTYSLAAVKDGYLLSDAAGIILAGGTTAEVNLACVPEVTLALGAIAGVVMVSGSMGASTPLAGAKVTLQNPDGTTAAVTYTAADGEFAFYDLADGVYTLISSAEGYRADSTMTAVITGGSIANVSMSMTVDTRTYNGTVSGIIRDTSGQAVAGCFVGLYRVTTVGTLTQEQLVAVTKTDSAGKYLFGGVTGGEYLVKAKLEQYNRTAGFWRRGGAAWKMTRRWIFHWISGLDGGCAVSRSVWRIAARMIGLNYPIIWAAAVKQGSCCLAERSILAFCGRVNII